MIDQDDESRSRSSIFDLPFCPDFLLVIEPIALLPNPCRVLQVLPVGISPFCRFQARDTPSDGFRHGNTVKPTVCHQPSLFRFRNRNDDSLTFHRLVFQIIINSRFLCVLRNFTISSDICQHISLWEKSTPPMPIIRQLQYPTFCFCR